MPSCRQSLPRQGPADRQVSVGPGECTEGGMGSVSLAGTRQLSGGKCPGPGGCSGKERGLNRAMLGAGGHCWCVGGAVHSWAQEHCPECPAVSALPSQAQHHNIFSSFCTPLILSLLSAALREPLGFAAAESGTALGIPARLGCPWEWGVHGNGVSKFPCALWG